MVSYAILHITFNLLLLSPFFCVCVCVCEYDLDLAKALLFLFYRHSFSSTRFSWWFWTLHDAIHLQRNVSYLSLSIGHIQCSQTCMSVCSKYDHLFYLSYLQACRTPILYFLSLSLSLSTFNLSYKSCWQEPGKSAFWYYERRSSVRNAFISVVFKIFSLPL